MRDFSRPLFFIGCSFAISLTDIDEALPPFPPFNTGLAFPLKSRGFLSVLYALTYVLFLVFVRYRLYNLLALLADIVAGFVGASLISGSLTWLLGRFPMFAFLNI